MFGGLSLKKSRALVFGKVFEYFVIEVTSSEERGKREAEVEQNLKLLDNDGEPPNPGLT